MEAQRNTKMRAEHFHGGVEYGSRVPSLRDSFQYSTRPGTYVPAIEYRPFRGLSLVGRELTALRLQPNITAERGKASA